MVLMSRYEALNRPHIDLLRPVATEYALAERYFQHAALIWRQRERLAFPCA